MSSLVFLDFVNYIGVKESTICNFSKPFCNGIMIYNSELLGNSTAKVLFGDEMTMLNWKDLKIAFGSVNNSLTLLTLNSNYTYTYSRRTSKLTITDNYNNLVPTDTSISSVIKTTSLGSTGTISISGIPTASSTTVYYLKITTAPTSSGDLAGMVVSTSTDGVTYTAHTAFTAGTTATLLIDGITIQFSVSSTTFVTGETYSYTVTQTYSRSITTVADLGIDFTIANSHNFVVELSTDDTKISFILEGAIQRTGGTSYMFQTIYGISDLYLPESPLFPVESGNYGRMGSISAYALYNYIISVSALYGALQLYGMTNATANLEQTAKYQFYITLDELDTIAVKGAVKKYNGSVNDISWLLAIMGESLYPALLPCAKQGETINNRPVYEPWMIWGFYKLLYNQYTNSSTDSYSVFCFDLSPNFGG